MAVNLGFLSGYAGSMFQPVLEMTETKTSESPKKFQANFVDSFSSNYVLYDYIYSWWGWTNPFEKYARLSNGIIFPGIGVKIIQIFETTT